MNDTLLEAIQEAYAIAPTQLAIIDTLEIRQEGVQDTIYIAQTRKTFTAMDENSVSRDFEPVGFQMSLPPVTEEGYPTMNIAIDNVGQRITDFIEAAKSEPVPIEIIYRPYVSEDLTQPQMDPPLVLYLKEVDVTDQQVSGRATFLDLVNRPFPNEIYTRDRFPTLG